MDEILKVVYTLNYMSAPLPKKPALKSPVKKIILWSVIIGGIVALFIPVFAQSNKFSLASSVGSVAVRAREDPCALFGEERCIGGGDVGRSLDTEDTGEGLARLIFSVINIFILIAGAVAVFFAVFAGYLILTSSGDQGQEKKGKETLRNALIGLVIVLLATGIVAVVQRFITGLNF